VIDYPVSLHGSARPEIKGACGLEIVGHPESAHSEPHRKSAYALGRDPRPPRTLKLQIGGFVRAGVSTTSSMILGERGRSLERVRSTQVQGDRMWRSLVLGDRGALVTELELRRHPKLT
jgi:hypothetical protein